MSNLTEKELYEKIIRIRPGGFFQCGQYTAKLMGSTFLRVNTGDTYGAASLVDGEIWTARELAERHAGHPCVEIYGSQICW